VDAVAHLTCLASRTSRRASINCAFYIRWRRRGVRAIEVDDSGKSSHLPSRPGAAAGRACTSSELPELEVHVG
jgi:hypothetical protein